MGYDGIQDRYMIDRFKLREDLRMIYVLIKWDILWDIIHESN